MSCVHLCLLSIFQFAYPILFVGSASHLTAPQFVEVLAVIYNQANIDVFLMDWERSRGRLERAGKDEPPMPVSVWRTLFVANEWNEIQTDRSIHLPLTLLGVLLILVGTLGCGCFCFWCHRSVPVCW